MSRRKPKEEPEMLIVSFCDIVTITTAAMFFALLITVQEAVKIPVFKPTPRARILDNKIAVFFECSNKQVFYIDKAGLDDQVEKLMKSLNLSPGNRSGDPAALAKVISATDVGNENYKVNPSYLLAAVMALELRPDAHGDATNTIAKADSKFHVYLRQLNAEKQYVVFLVRDDSFDIFRHARKQADQAGFDVGWELLGENEPIKFGSGGAIVPAG